MIRSSTGDVRERAEEERRASDDDVGRLREAVVGDDRNQTSADYVDQPVASDSDIEDDIASDVSSDGLVDDSETITAAEATEADASPVKSQASSAAEVPESSSVALASESKIEDDMASDVSSDGLVDDSETITAAEATEAGASHVKSQASSAAKVPDTFSFALAYDVMTRFLVRRNSRGLVGDWSDVMYQKFNEVYRFCALSFQYNHLRRAESKKSFSPFWIGKAKCRTGDCIQVTMSIQNEPVEGQDVAVDVQVSGTCQHLRDGDEVVVERPNRRQLRSDRRADTAELLTSSQQSATELHYQRLGEMSQEECRAANTTTCQTPAVLRQAAYERRRSQQLHEHVIMELDIARECWEASIPGPHFNGYIQQLGLYPFHVCFFTEQQVQTYVDQCRSEYGAVIHLDATGSVVSRIRDQKRTLYYCLLLSEGNLPILDILSSCHEAAWLQSLLTTFNGTVRRVNNGRLVTPRHIITDFSYALMHACINAFNSGRQIGAYLQTTYRVMCRHCTKTQLEGLCFLSLCASHMLKTMSVKLSKVEKQKGTRQLAMTYFAALQRTLDLQSAAQTYRDIALVLCSERETDAVSNARTRLHARVSGVAVEVTDDVQEPMQEDDDELDAADLRTLKAQSPFTEYFDSQVRDILCSSDDADDKTVPANATCSRRSFEQVCYFEQVYL